MGDKRQEIVNRLHIADSELDSIRKELQAFDHDNKLKEASQYLGKYYKQKNEHHKESVDVIFVHGIKEADCELLTICVRYWIGIDYIYTIENHYNFNPKQWDEEDKYIEITKEEFIEHYNEAQRRIGLLINKAK